MVWRSYVKIYIFLYRKIKNDLTDIVYVKTIENPGVASLTLKTAPFGLFGVVGERVGDVGAKRYCGYGGGGGGGGPQFGGHPSTVACVGRVANAIAIAATAAIIRNAWRTALMKDCIPSLPMLVTEDTVHTLLPFTIRHRFRPVNGIRTCIFWTKAQSSDPFARAIILESLRIVRGLPV